MTADLTVGYLTGIVTQLPGYGTEFPRLDALNMLDPATMCPNPECHGGVIVSFISESITQGELCPTCKGTEEVTLPVTVALTAEWDADHAAHITAVTGWHLWQPTGPGWISVGRLASDQCSYVGIRDFREGAVVAHATITGCHRAGFDCHCEWDSWARDGDGLWHWTCEVTPAEATR